MLGTTDASAGPKRPRHVDAGGDAGYDRLGALPDELLHAILSRLKALQMVRTCVLSTRWRHLWRTVRGLDVDQREVTGKQRYFFNFTNNLMRSHDAKLLEDFRLHLDQRLLCERWVCRAIGQDDTSWPCRLKRLHLSNQEIKLADLASHISSRCTALEDLQLESCGFWLTSNAKIVSSMLKKLVVDGEYMDYDDDDDVFTLIIEAPALFSLHLGDELDHIVDTTKPHRLPSLVHASIHLNWIDDDLEHQLGILGALSNVTTLHLSQFVVTLLFYEGHENLPVFKFENLRTLFLDECHICDDFLGLQQYLWNSRNIQKLTLRQCKISDITHEKEVVERRQSYSKDLAHFKCKNLRLSEIIYRDGDAFVHLLVKFFVGMWRNLPNNKIELTPLKKEKTNVTELTEVD